MLKEQSLPELIKTNIKVITEAKQLDSDENYSRFMTASKTVRTLQVNDCWEWCCIGECG